MGDWSEYFEDYPEENPANWVGGRYDPDAAAGLRKSDAIKRQMALDSQVLQQRMFAMAEAARVSAAMRAKDAVRTWAVKTDAAEHEKVEACPQMPISGLGELDLRTHIVLVDYENVQPKDLALLGDGPFKVKLFLGPNQTKIPVSLASALQCLGSNAEYVLLESAGTNALDFHIAYYIGVLSRDEPGAFFHIISKDSGFDPLIKHLKGKKLFVQRSGCIADIPYFKPALPSATDSQVEAVVADLVRRKTSKPRTQKTLLSTLHALFKKELSEEQLATLFSALCQKGVVKVEGAKVSYVLPDAQ
jgi:hypothetical protein